MRTGQLRLGKLFIMQNCCKLQRRHGAVSIATMLPAGQTRSCVSIPGSGSEIFLFSVASVRILRPTQPPIRWVPGFLPLG
jgi:hypothetical protein